MAVNNAAARDLRIGDCLAQAAPLGELIDCLAPIIRAQINFQVSAANVVATIEVPASHHGTLRPERKYSSKLDAARMSPPP